MYNWFKNLDEEVQVGLFIICFPAVLVLTIGLAVTLLRIIWILLGL